MQKAGASIRYVVTTALAGSFLGFGARAGAQQPMQAGGLAPPPPMQSGGLAPPPPGGGPPPPAPAYPGYPNTTQRHLDDADKGDSGRGLEWVYIDVGGGGQFAAFEALKSSGITEIGGLPVHTLSSGKFGPYFSAGAGLRFLFFTLGPRFRFATFSDRDLWTLNLDLGWHIPFGNFEPYAFLGGGYAKVPYHGSDSTSASGFDVRLGGGFDYYLSRAFSLGAKLDVDVLRLEQTIVFATSSTPSSIDFSTVGLVVTAGAVIGLHF